MSLKDFYNVGDDSYSNVYGSNWQAQTFKANSAYRIGSSRLKLYRVGLPGELLVSIQNVDENEKPISGSLCFGIINGNSLPLVGPPYEFNEIIFSSKPWLTEGSKYSIVAKAISGNSSNRICWRRDGTPPNYQYGMNSYSTNGGVDWILNAGMDLLFEIYDYEGEVIGMSDKLFKIGESIEVGYQAPNKQSELTGVVAEIYLPNKAKDSNFPDVELVEVGSTGTYRGSFTPDQQGVWQVIMHKADGDGQVTKSYSVGGYNVHSVGEKIDVVDDKVEVVEGKADTIITKLDGIEGSVGALDTPPMAF